jgi:hypothetical protein
MSDASSILSLKKALSGALSAGKAEVGPVVQQAAVHGLRC